MAPTTPPPRLTLDLSGTGACASFNFRRTTRAVTRLYDMAFQEFGIRSTQFTILIGIAKTQPVSMGGLADVLMIDRTTLTRSLGLLEKLGIIEISSRSTMRQRFITLTPHGGDVLARALPKWRQAQERFVQAVGSGYWDNFRDELESLANITHKLEITPPAVEAPQ